MPSWLDTLDDNTVVVTPTAVLAAELREQHAARCLEQGLISWPSPDVVPFAGWISRLWQQRVQIFESSPAVLLNTQQERALWEQCIAADARSTEHAILQERGAARHAQNAAALLTSWRARLVDSVLDDDAKAFKDWSRQFSQRLSSNHWTTLTDATDTLIEWVGQRRLPLPSRLLLAGFDVVSPQLHELLAAMRAVDIEVTERPVSACRASVCVLSVHDEDEELLAAAQWAADRVRARSGTGIEMPFGVVVPDLEAMRAKVIRIFDSVFVPTDSAGFAEPAYSVVGDTPLDNEPVVRDALAILTLGNRTIAQSTFEQCLRSPFIGEAGEELGLRSLAVASLRSLAETELSLVMWLQQLSTNWPESGLTARVNRLYESLNSRPRRQAPSAWGRAFSKDLAVMGWPGGIALTETEDVAVRRFEMVLDDLAALSMVLPEMGAAQALGRLRMLSAERTISRPRNRAAVVVLSASAAAGFEFDELWILGLHDGAFPRVPRPNPFLPARLQRAVQMPHSSAGWELDWAGRNVDRWRASASATVFSFPREAGDIRLRASPLIERLGVEPKVRVARAGDSARYAAFGPSRAELETLIDNAAPPVPGDADLSGGVGIFKAQAACPFQAFALYRLTAQGLGESGPGLDPMARGSLLHDVLERVWTSLKTQSALLVMSEVELHRLLDESVAAALRNWRALRPQTLRGRFERMEHDRHKSLVLAWLDIERERLPFSVEFSEEQTKAELGGLSISIRPDRLDRVDDGYLIIDYKSGTARVADWLDERLDEPQLPVYCLAMEDTSETPVAGVSFALVGARETKYHGLAAVDGLAPGIDSLSASKTSKLAEYRHWDELTTAWRTRLEALGADFRRGDARVQPKNADKCRVCELKTLCRIHERSVFAAFEDTGS